MQLMILSSGGACGNALVRGEVNVRRTVTTLAIVMAAMLLASGVALVVTKTCKANCSGIKYTVYRCELAPVVLRSNYKMACIERTDWVR